MRALDGRLVRNVLSLCLPTAAVVVFGVWFLVERVPDIIRNEHRRVQAEYREYARELKARPETGFAVIRAKSGPWAKDRKMAPGYWGTVPSGTAYSVPSPDGAPVLSSVPEERTLVWFSDEGNACVATLVETVEEVDFRLVFLVCVPFALFVLVGMTALGVRYFIDYVKARDDFMSATAHDLTTPLVGLRYMIGTDDEEAKILNERMLRLVANIKDFLKLGGRRTKPVLAEVDLLSAYREAYALFRADYRDLFDGDDVELSVDGHAPEGTLRVLADETMLVQVLWNLLGNDLKYAAPFGRVSVRIAVEDAFVRMDFTDEGKGMTPREMRRAFDRYYRAKTVLESGKGGFGIGLCTAREFARAMGGDLTVRANRPHGCTFTLSLPKGRNERRK